jgi:hypothetical protein
MTEILLCQCCKNVGQSGMYPVLHNPLARNFGLFVYILVWYMLGLPVRLAVPRLGLVSIPLLYFGLRLLLPLSQQTYSDVGESQFAKWCETVAWP